MVMKQHRKPKKDLKVTVTFSESDGPIAHSSHSEIPSVNIVAIRGKTGLSQSTFAARIGVPEGTLINWEQGRRQPSGPAKVLLALLAKKPDLVVVDPPRAGLSQKVVRRIVETAPKKIVYVSCNPTTLAPNGAQLVEAGYVLKKVRPVDMFPQTPHTEAVALFEAGPDGVRNPDRD